MWGPQRHLPAGPPAFRKHPSPERGERHPAPRQRGHRPEGGRGGSDEASGRGLGPSVPKAGSPTPTPPPLPPVSRGTAGLSVMRSERGPWRWAPKAGVPGLGHGDGRGLAGGGPGPQPCLSWAAEGRAACRKLLAGWEWGPLTSSPSPEGRLQRAELSGSKIFNFLSIFLDVAVYKRQILDKPHFALN